MTLPTAQEYFPYVLKFGDEPQNKIKYRDLICEEMRISPEDQQKTNSSGELTIMNRLGWAIHYLEQAKLMERPARGIHVITERGKRVREEYGLNVTEETLLKFEEFREFKKPSSNSLTKKKPSLGKNLIPTEKIENLISMLDEEIKNELRDQIFDASPYFFEKMVIDLLQKMGYGKFDGTSVTGKSRDEGIDGIVYQDFLGLEIFYVQAKRNSEGNKVGRPDLEKFIGSLSGKKATRGVFFTTSGFTKDALKYLNSVQQKIICIDGDKLLNLMLEHHIGVELRPPYKTYKIDEDYFSE